jgi:hypothetical protein
MAFYPFRQRNKFKSLSAFRILENQGIFKIKSRKGRGRMVLGGYGVL